MRWNGILATTIIALLAAASPAAADPFAVTTTDDLTGTTCGATCSIRQAIVASGETPGPDTIQIPAGTYQLSQGPLQITSAVTIAGASARSTAIYAASGSRVFQIAGTTASISHLTVGDGVANANDPHGGNIKAQSSTVLLDHVRVTNGSGFSGGGIANRNGSMTIQNSLIDHNRADMGGGDGGGIINFGGDSGAAAHLVVRDSTIAFNSARLTGGIIQYPNPDDSTSLESVTLAYNQTGDRGGGGNLAMGGGTASIRNSIVGFGQGLSGPAPNCSGSGQTSGGANVVDDATCAVTQPTDRANVATRLYDGLSTVTGETDVIPFYGDSPARDIGGTCSATDQTGAPRPSGPGCDAGAWELPATDDVAPDPPAISDRFEFSAESGATFECSLNEAPFSACGSPYSVAGLAPGDYILSVRAVDAAGNRSAPSTRSFSVPVVLPVQTPVPTPVPTAVPTPTAQPVRDKSVAVETEGTVTYKDKTGKFVPLPDGAVLPNGTEIDAKRGVVTITTSSGERARFFEGRFKVSQTGGITTATLSEPLDCKAAKRGSARAAASKPRTRKLWGDGKGRFRTKGQYSAATVRGTKWLVQDTCTTTLTRVAQGVVSVRDDVLKKTLTLRKGKSYVARAKKKK